MASVSHTDTVSSQGRTVNDDDDRCSLILSDIEEYDSFNSYVVDFNTQHNCSAIYFSEPMSSDPDDDRPPKAPPPGQAFINLDTLISDDQLMADQSAGAAATQVSSNPASPTTDAVRPLGNTNVVPGNRSRARMSLGRSMENTEKGQTTQEGSCTSSYQVSPIFNALRHWRLVATEGQFALQLTWNSDIARGQIKRSTNDEGFNVWTIPLATYTGEGTTAPPWTSAMIARVYHEVSRDAVPSAETDFLADMTASMCLASPECPNGLEFLPSNTEPVPFTTLFAPRRYMDQSGATQLQDDLRSKIASEEWREKRSTIPRILSDRHVMLMMAHYEVAAPSHETPVQEVDWTAIHASMKKLTSLLPSLAPAIEAFYKDRRASLEAILKFQKEERNLYDKEWTALLRQEEHRIYSKHCNILHLLWWLLPTALVLGQGVPVQLSDAEAQMETIWQRPVVSLMEDFGICGCGSATQQTPSATDRGVPKAKSEECAEGKAHA